MRRGGGDRAVKASRPARLNPRKGGAVPCLFARLLVERAPDETRRAARKVASFGVR